MSCSTQVMSSRKLSLFTRFVSQSIAQSAMTDWLSETIGPMPFRLIRAKFFLSVGAYFCKDDLGYVSLKVVSAQDQWISPISSAFYFNCFSSKFKFLFLLIVYFQTSLVIVLFLLPLYTLSFLTSLNASAKRFSSSSSICDNYSSTFFLTACVGLIELSFFSLSGRLI